jgi:hypothetical protein
MAFQVILTTAPTEDLGSVSLSLDFSSPNGLLGKASLPFGGPSQINGTAFQFAGQGTGHVPPFPSRDPGAHLLKQEPLSNFAETARYPDLPALPIDLDGAIQSGDRKVEFSLRNLFSNDTLHLIALSRELFLGNVFHGPHGLPQAIVHARCIATCADGKSGQDCVTCVRGKVTVKICC